MSDTLNDRFNGLISDPAFGALAGLTQGFASAAMPTRMPTPFGAVLGMGAAGLAQGAQNAQNIGIGQQKLEAAKIANQRAHMLTDWYNQQYGGGAAGGGAGTVVPGSTTGATPGSGIGGANSGYLMSPQELAGMARIAMGTGNERAVAPLMGLIQHYAGNPGMAMGANGGAFAVPGGSADPRVIFGQKYAESQAGVPAAIATTAGTEAIKGRYTPVTLPVPVYDANGNQIGTRDTVMSATDYANGGGSAPPANSGATGTVIPSSVFSQRVHAFENGGGPLDAKNPRSTATGDGQFIDSTWLQQFKQTYPDQAKNMSDQDILALRSDPKVSDAMIQAHAQANAALLPQNGIQPNATTLALAHRFGPAGATSLLKSPLTAPVASVLPKPVMDANPDLANQTVGQLVGNTTMRFGIAPVAFGGGGFGGNIKLSPQAQAALDVQTAWAKPQVLRPGGMVVNVPGGQEIKNPELKEVTDPVTGAKSWVHINPASPFAPEGTPGTTSPVVSGNAGGNGSAGSGAPVMAALGPGQEGTLKARADVQKQDIEHDRQLAEGDMSHVIDTANSAKQMLFQLRSLSPDAYTGAAGPFRAAMRNYVQTFAPQAVSGLVGDAAPAQEFAKVALMQAGKQERGDLGARGGFRAIEMYRDANPNLNMQDAANGHMANALLVSRQAEIDYAMGMNAHYLASRNQYLQPGNQKPYSPISEYDQQYANTFKPQHYFAAIEAINGKPFDVWAKGLSNKEQQIVAGIVQRTDPNSSINIHGRLVPIKAIGSDSVVDPANIAGATGSPGNG